MLCRHCNRNRYPCKCPSASRGINSCRFFIRRIAAPWGSSALRFPVTSAIARTLKLANI
ncbi:hypothetical protein Dform_00966 [Dehalogenimonas formicexedens]|uniref:Uncharacterized protein n=1 Tax=Dehalogenimonas formicexedens TaxID=1839801 RepID=A0A1P8F750_9CHLR|nr:hypothetical protein Dform_00966 [Dehalogenimonas formicexedens]